MIETLITSSALIVFILFLRPFLRRKVSPAIVYCLWGLVAIRMLVPWIYPFTELMGTMKSRFSMMNAVDLFQREVIEGSVLEPLIDNIATGRVRRYEEPVHIVQQAAGIDWQLWIMVVWVMGSILIGGWMILVNIRFMKRLQAARRPYKGALPAFVTKQVYAVTGISSPCYFGIQNDEAIYLPDSIMGDEKMVYHALAHETCHANHGDRYWGILRCVLLCYYWVNPFAWLGAVWSKRDCELACDEAAVKLLGEEERYAYGRTLVGLIAMQRSEKSLFLASATMKAGKRTIKDRIHTLTRHPKTTVPMAVVLMCVVAVLGACTFTQKREPEASPADTVVTAGKDGKDVLVLLGEMQKGNYYELELQRQDAASGEAKQMLREENNSFLTPLQAVQGIQDTSVWLKSVKEYPGALELVLTGETDEETLQFSLENEILLKPIGAEHPEAYMEVSQSARYGNEIHLLYLFDNDIPPLSQVMAIMAGDGTEESGYIENVFEEYQISMTAQQFIAACLTGDTKTAVRYSGVKEEELRNSIREGTPGSGTLTIRWNPEHKETYAEGIYKFHEEGQEDSFTYLNLALKKVSGEWIVGEVWVEK